MKRLFLNLCLFIFPPTRFFPLKKRIAVWAGIEANKGVSINGHSCFFGDGRVVIGEGSWIGLKTMFSTATKASVIIGKNCDIGPQVSFITGSHELGNAARRAGKGTGENIEVGDGCWIGARVTILGNVKIGSGVMVAAGSVVTKDVPSNCMVAGVPAVVKKVFPDEK